MREQMDNNTLHLQIRNLLLHEMAKAGHRYVPAAISVRHVHLGRTDIDKLFGSGYRLSVKNALSQPGQFACEETVTLIGPKGRIAEVRVLGPEREDTQVEISLTDSIKLGVMPVVRISGDIADTPGIRLTGPSGEVAVPYGAIVSARHIHMSDQDAHMYGLKNGDIISLRKTGVRQMVFDNVIVRAGSSHSLEVHLDTDEGNAAGIVYGDLLEILDNSDARGHRLETDRQRDSDLKINTPKRNETAIYETVEAGSLVTEEKLAEYHKRGTKILRISKSVLITPLAKDKAWENGISIEIVD
jgi:putative phosphotransacetylase